MLGLSVHYTESVLPITSSSALKRIWLVITHLLVHFNKVGGEVSTIYSASSASASGYQHSFQTFGCSSACAQAPSEKPSARIY